MRACVLVFIPTSSYWDKIQAHTHCGLTPSQREMRLTCPERDQVHKQRDRENRERGHMEEHKTTREESRGSEMASFNHQPDTF